MNTDDESRRGLVDLAVLGNYRLVNLARNGAVLGQLVAREDLALAALCEREHGADEDDKRPGPYLLTVAAGGGASDNLAELAWVAVRHDAEHHGGDQPYQQWEAGADLQHLYARVSTLWRGVEDLAAALGITWNIEDPAATFRAAVARLGDAEAGTPPPVDQPTPSRCAAICPREQAEAIAELAGIHRVDADWRCYLVAPHTVDDGQHAILPTRPGHLVRPTRHGHLYAFTEDGTHAR